MCNKKADHVVYFKPYLDPQGIKRIWTATIWEKSTGNIARACAILSLDDEPNDSVGRQMAYNKAGRCLAGRKVHFISTEKAWESIQALTALELKRFDTEFLCTIGNDVMGAYIDEGLEQDEYAYFKKHGYTYPIYHVGDAAEAVAGAPLEPISQETPATFDNRFVHIGKLYTIYDDCTDDRERKSVLALIKETLHVLKNSLPEENVDAS